MESKVSIVVITYNSSKTVCDTLDSILAQSYDKNLIELIITDDASTDSTQTIIQQWVDQHVNAFANIITLFQQENGGTSKNCNNGWKAATSPWIKTIAGDDILLPDCISHNIRYINHHPECSIVFSQCIEFTVTGKNFKHGLTHPNTACAKKLKASAFQQHRYLLKENFCPAPTSFIKNCILKSTGYADERFRLIDDWPLWLKFSKAGHKLHYLEEPTVLYRKDESITSSSSRLININYYNGLIAINDKMIKSEKGLWAFICYIDNCIEYKSRVTIAKLFNNKPSPLAMLMLQLTSAIRPLWYWYKLCKYRN